MAETGLQWINLVEMNNETKKLLCVWCRAVRGRLRRCFRDHIRRKDKHDVGQELVHAIKTSMSDSQN